MKVNPPAVVRLSGILKKEKLLNEEDGNSPTGIGDRTETGQPV